MEGTVGENSDLISNLPLPILHHILSYLSNDVDLARIYVLSKQWNSVRKSFPVIAFYQPNEMRGLPWPQFKERIRELLACANRWLEYLLRNKIGIKKFYFYAFCIDYNSVPLVDAWLPLALHNGVSDLRFNLKDVVDDNRDSYYAFPEKTFVVNSSLLRGSSMFFRLEELTLVRVHLCEKIVRDIIRNCPNIRYLSLENITGLGTLHISKLDKLKNVFVSELIYCPKLKRVSVDARSLEDFSLKVPESCKIDLTSCFNLRTLELFGSSISDDQLHKQISKFSLLEDLDISHCGDLGRIRLSLQRLKHLRVYCCPQIRAIEIDAPALSSFDFTECDKLPTIVISKLSFDPYYSRKPVNPPRVEVGCLDLTELRIGYSTSWAIFLDRLLSCCHPRIVTVSDEDNKAKILCKMLMRSKRQYRFHSRHCKCWRHRLRNAKIESIGNIGSGGEIKHKQFPRSMDEFLSNFSCNEEVSFRLDWDLSGIERSHHGLDFLDRFSLSSDF